MNRTEKLAAMDEKLHQLDTRTHRAEEAADKIIGFSPYSGAAANKHYANPRTPDAWRTDHTAARQAGEAAAAKHAGVIEAYSTADKARLSGDNQVYAKAVAYRIQLAYVVWLETYTKHMRKHWCQPANTRTAICQPI
jgi:hypothetical protein